MSDLFRQEAIDAQREYAKTWDYREKTLARDSLVINPAKAWWTDLEIVDGKIVGGIGVSGATADQDAQCARAGVDAVK